MRYGVTIRDPGPSSVLPMAYAQVMPRFIYISAFEQLVRYPVSLRSVNQLVTRFLNITAKQNGDVLKRNQMELYTVSTDIFRPFCCL